MIAKNQQRMDRAIAKNIETKKAAQNAEGLKNDRNSRHRNP